MSDLLRIRSYRGGETGGDRCWDVTCLARVTDPPTLDRDDPDDPDDPKPWKCGWSSRLCCTTVGAYAEGINHLRTCSYVRIQRALDLVDEIGADVAETMADPYRNVFDEGLAKGMRGSSYRIAALRGEK